MKRQYVVPSLVLLRITTHLLSGSGTSVNSVNMEGGDNLTITVEETSSEEGRAKENFDVWNNWED